MGSFIQSFSKGSLYEDAKQGLLHNCDLIALINLANALRASASYFSNARYCTEAGYKELLRGFIFSMVPDYICEAHNSMDRSDFALFNNKDLVVIEVKLLTSKKSDDDAVEFSENRLQSSAQDAIDQILEKAYVTSQFVQSRLTTARSLTYAGLVAIEGNYMRKFAFLKIQKINISTMQSYDEIDFQF
jgi:hypothetical protein